VTTRALSVNGVQPPRSTATYTILDRDSTRPLP
jgi:hypothetical protein